MGSRASQGWLWSALCSPLHRDKYCPVSPPSVPMGVLSCMKYLMFIFNVLVFAGGTCLAAMGVWVAVDPAGFQGIVAARAVLSAGAWLLLAVGIALSLLGFLGCCGALRRSRPLLLLFFILVSLIFLMQLIGAVLFLPEHFLSELQRNYGGDEGAEVFSTAWNTLMVTFSCCGVLGPEDFGNGSRFQELHPGMPWPRACCARDGLLQEGFVLLPLGLLALVSLCSTRRARGAQDGPRPGILQPLSAPGLARPCHGADPFPSPSFQIFAMFFAFCLYYNFD
uniref:Tetraspanin n=1 Tax=Zonotrichia albicollis TaxID=44394 RepID=A0A8D2NA32_ZONAL